MARQYAKTGLNGGFFEGGLYVSKHQIKTRSETSTLLPDPNFFFFQVYSSTVTEKVYKEVRSVAYALELAGKNYGSLTFECPGCINWSVFRSSITFSRRQHPSKKK